MDNKTVSFLLEHNRLQSSIFCGPDATMARRAYRAEHPTIIGALKCMDGRLNLPLICCVPQGIIEPFRNIAGEFDLGWPFFGETFNDWVEYAMRQGRKCLVLVTYHWSKGDVHRGCKGFRYDVCTAKKFVAGLKAQIERVYGEGHSVVYPIMIGIETDEDALVLHGDNENITLNVSQHVDIHPEDLAEKIRRLYPGMTSLMMSDLLPLLLGNAKHVRELRAAGRPTAQSEHREQIIGFGRGFDWLHLMNRALLIGPYSYDCSDPIATAGGILLENARAGRTDINEGLVLMVSAPYRDGVGPEPLRAAEKALSMARYAMCVLRDKVPEIIPALQPLVGTMDANTRLFNRLDFS